MHRWILVFSDDNPQVNEARCIIALPRAVWRAALRSDQRRNAGRHLVGEPGEGGVSGRGDCAQAGPGAADPFREGENFLQCFPVPSLER